MSFHSLGRSGLVRALLLSLAFHFLLLWPSPTTRQAADSSTALVATIQTAPLPQAANPAPPASHRPAQAAPPSASRNQSQSIPAVPAPVSPLEPPNGLTIGNASRSSSPDAVSPAGQEQAPLDAEGLRGFRIALARQARQYKHYPKRAEERGWEGTAEVRVTLLAGGFAQEPTLIRSSGHEVLDQAALEMLRKAQAATPVPQTLRQRNFAVDLPVVFELPE